LIWKGAIESNGYLAKEFQAMSEKNPPPQPQKKPRTKGSLSLQRKFLVGVGVIFLGFCLVIALLIYSYEKSLLEEAAHEKSEMVMAAAEASRNYIQHVLRPKMYELLGQDAFVLEAMSTSYVGRAVMERFKESMPDYQIRRVALHARNPASEPRPFEVDLITFFAAHPQQHSWKGMVKIAGQSNFLHSRPVFFSQECMHCHGNPDDAPPALLKLYGRERGFGYKPGDIAGVTAVSIPVDVALAKIKERAISVFGISLFSLSLLYVGICFFFNRVVVHSLRDLLEIFRLGLRDEKELQLLTEAKAKDEIGELTAGAQVMVGHLRETRQQLEEYTGNLERMVAQRTKALEDSQQHLQEKVAARNQELHTLNTIAELITRAVNLADILPKVLLQTLKLIPARGAALYLLRDNPACLELQCQERAGQLIARMPIDSHEYQSSPEDGVTDLSSSLLEAASGHMNFFACEEEHNCLNVPLICRGKVMGVMTFVNVDFKEITSERRELLLCVGQQIGITIESLQNVEQLVHSKDLLQSVFDGITDMMVLLDRDLRIKMVNKAYLQHYGVTLDEVLDKPCPSPLAAPGCPLSQGRVEAAFHSHKPMTEEVQTSDGEIFMVHSYPIIDDKGEVASMVRYAKNITAEKRVEQRIQHAEKMAALGQLAGGIAHEINNPLGVILCYADLLKGQLADLPQSSLDVTTIEKHARNCQRIVADLLKFARGQETARELALLNPTIEEVVQMVDYQFLRQHCRIALDLDPHLPRLRIDVDKMKQVFLNLLMNAQQASKEPEGNIRISTRQRPESGQVEIVFWDNGAGIPPEIIDRIFDPFFSTKKTGEGTGLGLSVSYGIIKDHGGDIQVASEPGQWTQFTIVLPMEEQG
jgi:two-component system NtrC family sensor kinase